MASVFSHAAAALAIGYVMSRPGIPRWTWAIGAACSAIPDVDVIGFRFGIRYGDFWGHRGFTHSLLFAALLAAAALVAGFWRARPSFSRAYVWAYLFIATASHGLLDAMTDGGLGVAFFSPFDNRRYFLPFRPIHVSPIAVGRFFTDRGLTIMKSELLWIWLPATLLVLLVWLFRQLRTPQIAT